MLSGTAASLNDLPMPSNQVGKSELLTHVAGRTLTTFAECWIRD